MLLPAAVNAQNQDFLTNLIQLSEEELLDTAKKYLQRNSLDTALIYYNLLIKVPAKDTDIEQQKRIVKAYINLGVIYYLMGNYLTACEYFLKALALSEKYNFDAWRPHIYGNMGIVYYHFKKFDRAKTYYTKAISMKPDSASLFAIMVNFVALENDHGTSDSAFHYINKAMQISKEMKKKPDMSKLLNNIAACYDKVGNSDSTYHYYRLSLETARKGEPNEHNIESEAVTLLNMSIWFYEKNQPDSALFYNNLSMAIAVKNNYPKIIVDNYHYLSKIEEQKGNIRKAFEHYKTYSNLKDSIQNIADFGKINQLERLYEVSKTNQEIEQLIIDRQIKEIILYVSLFVLLLISIGFIVVYLQKRNLNRAYKVLFQKNIEIEKLEKSSKKPSEIKQGKIGANTLTAEMQRELLQKILDVMEDTSVICDPEFTMDKLAAMIQSNQNYVSHVINSCLKKNFRSLLNGYRINEAKRILAETENTEAPIGAVAERVGYKSQSTFFDTFKEVTGLTPKFYLKSIQSHLAENREDGDFTEI